MFDLEKIKKSASEIEKHPPAWLYVLCGILILIAFQFLRAI